MSFDKQNFARTVQEQQAGISPQMWPIKLNPGAISLNSPFEVDINPCDCIWLPYTYDKSYGQPTRYRLPGGIMPITCDPTICGQNFADILDAGQGVWVMQAPIIGLRFNSPNNPWMLWSLGGPFTVGTWGLAPSSGKYRPVGYASMMQSLTGPISRIWCQYYRWGIFYGNSVAAWQQIVLMSMAGFSHQSTATIDPIFDGNGGLTALPPTIYQSISSGGYRTTDLNSADLRVLGQNPMPAAPTTSGKGSTTG